MANVNKIVVYNDRSAVIFVNGDRIYAGRNAVVFADGYVHRPVQPKKSVADVARETLRSIAEGDYAPDVRIRAATSLLTLTDEGR